MIKNINLINPQAIQVCQQLQQAGFQAFIVGGCVRDLLLQQQPKDWDICTDATPQKVMKLFPKHYATGLQHGTITVSMGEGIENHFEVTTFRIEGTYSDGRRPEEVFFVSNIEEDLSRRDLTINAIAYDPINKSFKDPYNGQNDLLNKIIKAVGNPLERFQEDGLRIMRAARFAARFNYNIEPNTLSAMANSLETLKKVSMERIRDELCKILMTDNPFHGISILRDIKALDIVGPHLNINELSVLLKGELETRIAFLYYKAPDKTTKEDLERLKFSNKEISKVLFLFELSNNFLHSEKDYKLLISSIKNKMGNVWQNVLNEFIILSGSHSQAFIDSWKDTIVLSRKEMNIDGNDLIEIGIKPGPQIKQYLDECYQLILEDHNWNLKEKLLNHIKTEKVCNKLQTFSD